MAATPKRLPLICPGEILLEEFMMALGLSDTWRTCARACPPRSTGSASAIRARRQTKGHDAE